jgi:3-oxoacyl-[acyl-carrier protein] reductase
VNLGLRGRVALVCGASRGLGRAIAEELAAEGAALALCARTSEPLARAAADIHERFDVPAYPIAADLAEPIQAGRVVEETVGRYERLDVLIANTGGPTPGSFESLRPADWDHAVALLLGSVVALTARALPAMRRARWGRILAVTSIAAKQPVDNLMLSNTLRPAVSGFAHALAREVASDGITVNTILPGYTRTGRLAELEAAAPGRERDASRPLQRIEAEIPLGRLAEPKELAALAAFLVSERASYITGAAFAVDGGWLRGLY